MIARLLDGSVSRKVMALVLASTGAALLVAAVVLVAYEVATYRQAVREDLTTQAEILARATAPALVFDDREAAAGNISLLRTRPDILAVGIYTAKGDLFASYSQDPSGGQFPSPPAGPRYSVAGKEVTLFQAIVENGESLGTVYLRARYELRERLLGYIGILASIMLISLMVAAALSRILQDAVTKPILAVAFAARKVIEERDFSLRVQRTSNDEVGVLVDAFNAMLAELGGRAVALEREMSERRAAEATLRDMDRRKDEFLATLAHELRNPLAPITTALAILDRGDSSAEAGAQARDMMERQLRQLVRLVDDLLDVSRITTGRLVLRREVIELGSVIRSAVETVRPLVQAREHTLELRLPEQAIPVDADATRLAQVFSNLLTNAAKYTEPGGKLRLGAHVAGNEAIVDIVDNGIGISPDVLPVIFDMFVQADTSLERRQSGLGVGLALAKRLVELHGGRLDAHSEGVNRGSRFTVTLPTSTVREGVPARPPTSTSPRAPSCRILLVDDNVDFVTSLAALLHASGHEVMTAHDGAEAIQVALRFRPQVAFLDIGLPGLNGYDLARRLRALPETAQTLLIAITGWGQEQDKRRAKAAGFDKHFVKPVEFHVIEELLDRCFAEQHGTRE